MRLLYMLYQPIIEKKIDKTILNVLLIIHIKKNAYIRVKKIKKHTFLKLSDHIS